MSYNDNGALPVREAEKATLSAMLLDANMVKDISAHVTGEMFTSPHDENIFDAICYINTQTGTTDPILVADRLASIGQLDKLPGGLAYLHGEILPAATAASAGTYYAEIVARNYVSRSLVHFTAQTSDQLGKGRDPFEVASEITSFTNNLLMDANPTAPALAAESYSDLLSELEDPNRGIPTGLRDFDEKFGGLERASLNVVAARPAVGKTVFALTLARNIAKRGIPVLFYSLEMTTSQMLARILNAECRIPTNRLSLTRPNLTEQDWAKISEVMPSIMDMPLYISANVDSTYLEDMVVEIREFHRSHPKAVVIIDYLQLVETRAKYTSRQEQVATISRTLKKLTNELETTVVALAQLNRSSETRSDHEPKLSDIRESGAVEQDANTVMGLHREDYYEPESPRAGEMDIIMLKSRSSATGKIAVAAQMHYMNVCDMAVV